MHVATIRFIPKISVIIFPKKLQLYRKDEGKSFVYKYETYLSCYTHDVTLKNIVNVGALL